MRDTRLSSTMSSVLMLLRCGKASPDAGLIF